MSVLLVHVNSCKFEIIRYTFSNGPVINYTYLANDGSEITEKEHLSDLGVTMSNNAAFQDHISNIARTSRIKLGWVYISSKRQNSYALPMESTAW